MLSLVRQIIKLFMTSLHLPHRQTCCPAVPGTEGVKIATDTLGQRPPDGCTWAVGDVKSTVNTQQTGHKPGRATARQLYALPSSLRLQMQQVPSAPSVFAVAT